MWRLWKCGGRIGGSFEGTDAKHFGCFLPASVVPPLFPCVASPGMRRDGAFLLRPGPCGGADWSEFIRASYSLVRILPPSSNGKRLLPIWVTEHIGIFEM